MSRNQSTPEQQSVRVLKVGERVRHILSELLARQGANVRVASRSLERAQSACEGIAARVEGAALSSVETGSAEALAELHGETEALAGINTVTWDLLLDQSTNRAPGLIPVWIPLELVLGLAIGAPILQLGAG